MKHRKKVESNDSLERRSFVKITGLAAGGLLTSSIPFQSMAQTGAVQKLKLAVVGCGGRGTVAVVQALTADPDVELVAMADAFKDRVESSLSAIQEHFEGTDRIAVKEKYLFYGLVHFFQGLE